MTLLRSRSSVAIDDPPVGSDADEADLVARAKHGEATAFAQLYRRYVGRVYAFTARRLVDRVAAEEATQETFVRALTGLGRCRSDAALAGWLFAIARHVVNEQERATSRQGELPSAAIDPEDPEATPEEQAMRDEAVAPLRAAREHCLGSGERVLLDLLVADLTDSEIAVALGRRPGAVRTARWRLVLKLRDCLGIHGHHTEGRHVAL
jgi:RNA polymerase sigma-70 factor (ECF subfamily)